MNAFLLLTNKIISFVSFFTLLVFIVIDRNVAQPVNYNKLFFKFRRLKILLNCIQTKHLRS